MTEDKVIKNINLSLIITSITGFLAIGLFVWAYLILNIIWLIIVPIVIAIAIIVFIFISQNIKQKYLYNLEESKKIPDINNN